MKTSIIILTYNKLDYTKKCIESIRKYTNKNDYELIIVDNNSTDETVGWLKKQDDIKLILNKENLGFPKGCNQGIQISKGDNILLLNNDVVVTPNWLVNLKTALYSSDDIGAVGPVSNSCPYYQTIPTDYKNLDEMIEFAKKYNLSNENKWEERLKLIGFCMLIKKEIINKVGFLDEIFTPGNYEDDDYSIRIKRAGYKLILCKDTFIHHYGGTSFKVSKGYSELLKDNEIKFKKKWGFTSRENMNIYFELVDLINEDKEKDFKVLDIGSGCGATLLYLKNKYKNAKIYGIDKNEKAINKAKDITKTYIGDIESIHLDSNEKFDYIIMGDLIQKLKNPFDTLNKLKLYLKNKGKILISIQNDKYIDRIYDNIYENEKIIKQNIQIEDLLVLIQKCGYKNIDGTKIKVDISDEQKNIIFNIKDSISHINKEELLIKKYIVCAEKEEYTMNEYLLNIDNEINIEQNIISILNILKENPKEKDNLLQIVDKEINKKVEILNIIATKCYENEIYDCVIPLLQRAFDYDNSNEDILINLGLVLYNIGEYELSLFYLEKINNKTEEIISIIEEINSNVIIPKQNKERNLKFLLRRIENDIEVEESINKILNEVINKELDYEEIIESITTNIIEKEKLLNLLGIKCYENELYDCIIPFLEKAYEINSENIDTIYNLGCVLYNFGEKKVALEYLEKIENIDDEIDMFIQSIRKIV
ncbi:glycosyltransferase [Tepidibacter sp. Z1-5]|uniref:glycosyltransferase n=1 Tax=Tepidibacter sp. Z1-5 TaxID=3134138 RepID=UPI0030C3F00C